MMTLFSINAKAFCFRTLRYVSFNSFKKSCFSTQKAAVAEPVVKCCSQNVFKNDFRWNCKMSPVSVGYLLWQRKWHLSAEKSSTRPFTTGRVLLQEITQTELKRAIENLTDKFMEARELLSDARESQGSVYFSEDMEEAQEAVSETVKEYSELLTKLSEQQRQDVLRTIGLKMEELKAQLQAIEEELKEDH